MGNRTGNIRRVAMGDTKTLCKIFNYYVKNSIATFEMKPHSFGQMEGKISSHPEALPWLVYEEDKVVMGYARATHWKGNAYNKSAYEGTFELSVYVNNKYRGRGIGKLLYAEVLRLMRRKGYRSLLGGIALPNDACVALHEHFNFVKTAHFKAMGIKLGKRIDVGYWQLNAF
ncbi:GNAT family N-acetyltransferase [Aureisphaera galaxeae]|uniref:GNAT family N-acetyltransferase n=1 Tax=Aureisphaera galaxeae TaxID=1538023 RepID=UPI00234FBBED|nr:GNAT family N-acetyltransferase [Aureisphaera galaxeae]MDC8004690.1 GNAT family N-acetyltransferase [Aureisphaera galaxeae]